MEAIVIPKLDDDEDDFQLPLAKPSFGAASSTSSFSESDPYAHRTNPSGDAFFPAKTHTTPTRPTLPQASASYSVGIPTPNTRGHGFGQPSNANTTDDRSKLGKFNNGSSSSLVTPGTSISSSSGFLQARKGSLASLKNAFKSSSSNNNAIPPVPALDSKAFGSTPGYPALRNPFSRFDSPISPKNGTFKTPSSRSGKTPSTSSPAQHTTPGGSSGGGGIIGYHNPDGRKYSIASSHRSQGGRSINSQGSSGFRAEDHPMPALPPIPTRQTPSRMNRMGSDASVFGFTSRRNGSLGGDDSPDLSFGKTPGEEALKIVFKDFKESADQKVARICARPLNTQPNLPQFFDAGVDPAFDSTINSLAHCGTRYARRVVDLLTNWCRGYTGNIGASEVRAHLDRSGGLQMRVEDAAAILQSRKSSSAKFIMNRSLIELLKITPKDSLDQELGNNLEQNSFNAYKSEKLEEIIQFPHRKAVSNLQIGLLGQLSNNRFLTVSDRFIRELSKYINTSSTSNNQISKENEIKIEHLLEGMNHLKLKVYPEEELEMSSEFITSLANFFINVHGQSLKIAYAETFTSLLHPVIETATAEVNHPMWSKAITIILERALVMAQKARYWPAAFPLIITALGVSPREVFLQQWQFCIDSILAKFKDRNLRSIAMGAFIRVLWIYLNRCPESSTSMRKRLDPLIRTCFTSIGTLYPPELPSDPFIAVLLYIMTRHLDYGEEFVSEFLKNGAADGMADRSTVLVRAINYTLRNTELEKHAAWPSDSDFTKFDFEGFEASGETLPFEAESKPEVHDLLKRCGPAFVGLLFQCDNHVKHLLLSNDSITLSGHASSHSMDNATENITLKHGDVFVTYPARYASALRLMSALLETFPRCMPNDVNFPQVINVLCRAVFSADPNVCAVAGDTLRRICQDPERCSTVVNTFREFIFETRHVFRDTFMGARLLESQFERVIKLWLDLLQTLVAHQRVAEAQAIDDDSEKRSPPIEPSQINKIEGCALFLLCSTALPIRKLANQILVAARNFEGQQRRPSAAFRYSRISPDRAALTRVLQIFEYTVEESDLAAVRGLPWMTSSDRHRIDLLSSKDKSKLLQRIAESEHPKDGLLWLSVLPFFVGKVVEQLPGPASELRQVVCQLVLRLQAHVALVAGSGVVKGTPGRGSITSRTSSDTTILADHWRAYLSVLCVTMSSKGPAPPTPPVQRTKDVVILNQEMVNTPGIFQYLTSLLGWEDPRFKEAAVYAMGSIGQDFLRPLSEILLSVVRRLADGSKVVGTPRSDGTSRRTPLTSNGPIWTSIGHIFRLISPLLLNSSKSNSNSNLTNLSSMIGFVKLTYLLLNDRTIKEDFELQSLRRSFCIVVDNLTNSLGKLDSASDRFLTEDLRGSIFKLCFEWCHIGRRPDVAKARESQTLQAAAEGYRGDRDRAQYLDDLQAKTKLLSAAAAEAMAGLCQGKLISANEATPAQQASDHIVEPLTVLRWIRGMFSSSSISHHETGRRALFALLKYNWDCERLLDEVLHQSFGEGEQFSLESSFFGVVADVLSEGHHILPIEQVACLALSKLGHPVSAIRQRAFQLTESLYMNPSSKLHSTALFPAIGSSSANIYRNAQKEMSSQLASIYGDQAFEFLAECTTRLSQLEAPRRQATLSILRPWVEFLDLASDTSELSPEDAAAEHHALQNLVYLAVRFSDDHLEDIKSIFVSFADAGYGHQQSPPQTHNTNTTALMRFLFEQGGKRKSPEFVNHAQRIMACLAQSKAGDTIFEEICNFVEPNAMAALPEADIPPSPMSSIVNLDSLMNAPSSRSQTFSTGQLALLFAGELLPHRLDDIELGKRLPSLLHAALIHTDHTSSALRDQAQSVMFQTLRSWICDLSNVPTGDAAAIWSSTEHKLTSLARTSSTAFWKTDDVGDSESTFLAPPKMTNLIMKILGILSPLQPRIRQQWGELALSWATSCPIRHLACRSFQVFRILSPRVNPRMVSDTLARLSSTIASPSPEIQAFNQEVLRTFAAMVQNLSMSEAFSYPQIFWCSVACLSTPFENEFTEVIELLSHVLDKTNLSDPSVVAHLVSFRPPDWVGPAPYLQSLLLVGLRSSKTAFLTFDLIRRLTSASQDELIDSPTDRLLHGFIAALPWMLHSLDVGEPNEELASMALDLASLADQQGNASFSRLLTSFAKVKFRAKDDFIRQASSLLRDYMSTHSLDILTLLLGFILNTNDWMREKSMSILKLILQHNESKLQIEKHGNELLLPLLRLVGNSKHSSQALDVLDLPFSTTPSSTFDNNGGAMSPNTFSKSGGGEIFGSIKDDSGWSIPKLKELSLLTKENVHSVFNTCAIETRAASAHFSIVQFTDLSSLSNHQNRNGFNNPYGNNGNNNHSNQSNLNILSNQNQSQISFDLPSPPLSSLAHLNNHNNKNGIGGIDNSSIGDLVGALHSLGQFFDDGIIEEEDSPSQQLQQDNSDSPNTIESLGNNGNYISRFGGNTRRGSDSKSISGHKQTGSDVSERRLRAIMARGHQASISSPIYETSSPSQNSTINGSNPNFGNIPNYNRAFIHRSNMSISMTSESSITSSQDERDRDNITQRLNFSLFNNNPNNLQNQGNNAQQHIRNDSSGGIGRHSRNNSNLNVFLNSNANSNGRKHGHGPMESVSSFSDLGEQNAFGLDDGNNNNNNGAGMGNQSMVSINSFMNRQAIWENNGNGNGNGSPDNNNDNNSVIDLNDGHRNEQGNLDQGMMGRSEQNTPVLARRNVKPGGS